MIGALARFSADRRGLAALEFALTTPILVLILMFGADSWIQARQLSGMHSALQSGARYYQTGGSDDGAAQSVALQAWNGAPADAALTVSRNCACGTTPTLCASQCPNADTPQTFIVLTASGTFTGLMDSRPLSDSEVIRVR